MFRRAWRLCLAPKIEWAAIALDSTSGFRLFAGHVLPIVGASTVAYSIHWSRFGNADPVFRDFWFSHVVFALIAAGLTAVGLFAASTVIDFLAPTFGGKSNISQALKLSVYSYTPALLTGWPLAAELPYWGPIAGVSPLYVLYLFYLGIPRLMNCPSTRAIWYLISVLLLMVVLFVACLPLLFLVPH